MSTAAPFTLYKVTNENADYTIPALLTLIKGLALYEKAPELVFATEELLRRNLLGEGSAPLAGRYAETMLAYVGGSPEEGGEAIAMALYFYTFSTWTGKGGVYLEDLYVEEAHRGKGVAKALFAHLGRMCEEQDLARLDWVVLDWNVSAKEVYRKMGALPKPEWEGMRMQGEALKKLAQ